MISISVLLGNIIIPKILRWKGLPMNEKELMEVIGVNVRRFRKARGMTQEEFAEAVNRSSGSISHIETGSSIMGVELLVTMADLFSVSVDDLVRPENTSSHLKTITGILSTHSKEELASLVPFIQLCDSQSKTTKSIKEE